MVSDRISNYNGGVTLVSSRVENPTNSQPDGKNEEIMTPRLLQFQVLKQMDLQTLKNLQAKLLNDKTELETFLQSAEIELPKLRKLRFEIELMENLNSVLDATNEIDDTIIKQHDRYVFEYEQKKERLKNLVDVLKGIQEALPLKLINDNIQSIKESFVSILKQFELDRKKIAKPQPNPLTNVIQRLYNEIRNTSGLSISINKVVDQEELHPAKNLIPLLANRLTTGQIHVSFLNNERLFTIADYLDGQFDSFILEQVESLFADGIDFMNFGENE